MTRFVVSRDGFRIAFDLTGSGAPIVLLHGGLVHNRSSWREAGYVARLGREFSVITMDIRGHGESEAPERPEDYSPGKLVADIQAVADACGVERFLIWGFSYGGSIALQAASRSERVIAAIVAGSYFGRLLSPENFHAIISSMEKMIEMKEKGSLNDLPDDRRTFAEQSNLRAGLAIFAALSDWQPVEPGDLLCPTLVYCGSRNDQAMSSLGQEKEKLAGSRAQIQVFEGLDHAEEFSSIDIVYEPVVSFINSVLNAGH